MKILLMSSILSTATTFRAHTELKKTNSEDSGPGSVTTIYGVAARFLVELNLELYHWLLTL